METMELRPGMFGLPAGIVIISPARWARWTIRADRSRRFTLTT
jgi:hypothetical protein